MLMPLRSMCASAPGQLTLSAGCSTDGLSFSFVCHARKGPLGHFPAFGKNRQSCKPYCTSAKYAFRHYLADFEIIRPSWTS
jgi:hypothetical protein